MKITKIIVVLLILLGVSAYATTKLPVYGYTDDVCKNDQLEFDSYADLVDYHEDNKKNWQCKSYRFQNDAEEKCHEYKDIPTIKVVGTPLPDWGTDVDDTDGDAGSVHETDAPFDYLDDNPGKNFNQEDIDKVVDCLLDAAASNASIKNWQGDRTEATWLDETNETWSPTDDDKWYHSKYGEAKYRGGNTPTFTTHVYMHGINMGNAAQKHTLPYRHVLIYWHLHEYVHVLQAEQERNDEDEQFKPSFSDYDIFLRELEAIETVDEWWRALFGDDFDPPYTMPPHLLNYDEDAKRWAELQKKNLDGTISEDEKEELKDLTKYFQELHKTVPKAEPVSNYKSKKLKHCP
ncbi:MAG: hypothetical protein F4039_09815 [Gammaproteobacteria bacterium]|nr:hypothetical protein [Gammaproteobacteria bacterium]MYK44367.1 hypothetical protein [Gammaproteobacteria bacterium]